MTMSKQKWFVGLILIGPLVAIAATVHWEEEVLLNTGEIIWVNKEVNHSIKGQAGNPLDLGYRPDNEETISFKYGGNSYYYKGRARIFVLAISPQGVPALLAFPGGNDWYRYNEFSQCAKPYYVQLMPPMSGSNWTWPDQIESWTYNLPANLLIDRPPYEAKAKYTQAEISTKNYSLDPRVLSSRIVNPLHTNQDCREPQKP